MTHHNKLSDYRISIDNLDSSLLHLLAERTRLIIKTGVIKKRQHIDVEVSEERKKDLENTIKQATSYGLNNTFLESLFSCIYQHSLDIVKNTDQDEVLEQYYEEFDLPEIRKSLIYVDHAICLILVERFHIASKVGIYKKEQGLPPLDKKRWQKLLDDKKHKASQLGVSNELIESLFDRIHDESLRLQS